MTEVAIRGQLSEYLLFLESDEATPPMTTQSESEEASNFTWGRPRFLTLGAGVILASSSSSSSSNHQYYNHAFSVETRSR